MQTQPVDSQPLPPVERVRRGCGASRCRCRSCSGTCVYAFETDRGPFIVDADGTRRCLRRAELRARPSSFDIADVQGVMVTHIHPDHYGLAGRIRETSGAWIALHPPTLRSSTIATKNRTISSSGWAHICLVSVLPDAEIEGLRRRVDAGAAVRDRDARRCCPGRPNALTSRVGPTAVWTPATRPVTSVSGPANQLMLTGDCVLPRITPNVNLNPQTGDDPSATTCVRWSVSHLRRRRATAHEWRFGSLRNARASCGSITSSDSWR